MTIRLEGQISKKVANELINKLKPIGLDKKIEIGDLEEEADFIPDIEFVISLSGALAAVLMLALELSKMKQPKEKKGKTEVRSFIEKQMAAFGVKEIEITEVSNISGLTQSPPNSCKISLRDIPSNSKYRISISPRGRVNVKRLLNE